MGVGHQVKKKYPGVNKHVLKKKPTILNENKSTTHISNCTKCKQTKIVNHSTKCKTITKMESGGYIRKSSLCGYLSGEKKSGVKS